MHTGLLDFYSLFFYGFYSFCLVSQAWLSASGEGGDRLNQSKSKTDSRPAFDSTFAADLTFAASWPDSPLSPPPYASSFITKAVKGGNPYFRQ